MFNTLHWHWWDVALVLLDEKELCNGEYCLDQFAEEKQRVRGLVEQLKQHEEEQGGEEVLGGVELLGE